MAHADVGRDHPQRASLVGENSHKMEAISVERAATWYLVGRPCRAPTWPTLGRGRDGDGLGPMTR
jgi:hypothetical protein